MNTTSLLLGLLLWALLFSDGLAQRTCVPGQFVSGDECLPCQKQRVSMIANATECTRCEDGTIPTRARSRCVPCPIGRFFTKGSLSPCRRCPINTFSSEPMSFSCQSCPEGRVSEKESKSEDACVICPIGTVLFRSPSQRRIRCNECPAGMTTSSLNAPECLPCPKGQFRARRGRRLLELIPTASGISSRSSFFCRMCPAGTFTDLEGADECKRCPVGTFQNEVGASHCKPCPPGSESRSVGSRECRPTCATGSPGCNACGPGFQFNVVSERCERCPDGTVSIVRSTTSCFPCPPGESGVNAARTRCVCSDTESLRKDGTCVQCATDFVSLDGRRCTCGVDGAGEGCRCPPRTKRIGNRCEACDPAEDQDCERCDIGQFTRFVEGINVCERCAPGTFQNRENSDDCRPCPLDRTTVAFGDMSKCQCGPGLGREGGQCRPCPPGTFSGNAENRCTKCFRESFNDMPGAETCMRCRSARRRGATTCPM